MVTLSIIFPIPENADSTPSEILPKKLLLTAASFSPDTYFPSLPVTVKTAPPILAKISVSGNKLLTTVATALPTKLNTENIPWKVFLIFLAVLSFILNFSVRSWNFLDNSTNLGPVIEGNTCFQASPMAVSPLPSPCIILVKPFITASLPPLVFQNSSILFLASVDGPIMFSNP